MVLLIEKKNNQAQISTSSSFSYEGKGATSSIASTVDMSFNLIDEQRTESLSFPDKKIVSLINKSYKTIVFFKLNVFLFFK